MSDFVVCIHYLDKNLKDQWLLVVVGRDQWIGGAQRMVRAVKLLWYYNGRYISLDICPNPRNECTSKNEPSSKLWIRSNNDVLVKIHQL